MPDPGIPSPEPIKEITEKITNFIQWLAKLVLAKDWVALLVLLIVIAIIGFRPESGFVLTFLRIEVPDWYAHAFTPVLSLIFLTAIIIAIKTAPRSLRLEPEEQGTRKAIKGLRSFSVEDAEIFAKLQRNQIVQDCLESITHPEFCLGILVGESGCGKSSLLQAGLVPRLNQPESPLRAIYIKFSDRPPIETICAALVTQLAIPREQTEQTEFLSLLEIAVKIAGRPLILLLDQFEQFFVHYPMEHARSSFIQALAQWYNNPDLVSVKILVSIRADLQYELNPLQKALDYSISPYNIFSLRKFETEEATAVLQVLADSEELGFDPRFVKDIIENNLAGVDGKVSPVDIQILAEAVRKQRKSEQRQFTREAFQKLGGVKGLLNRYLEVTLASLKIQGYTSLYQASLQVLLALTDYNRRLRANLLTLTELQKKLDGIAAPREVIKAVNWLAASDVRLITPVEYQQQIGYELAHERIIPALLHLTGKELGEVEKARQLLEIRTQEWMGNQRNSRYLLNWHELRLIRIYKNQLQLDRDGNRRAKEQLLQKSWKRVQIIFWALALILLLILTAWFAWLSPPVQYRYAIWNLTETSQNVPHWTRRASVRALAKNGKWVQASKIAHSMPQDPYNTSQALNEMASVAILLEDISRAKALLQQAEPSAEAIQNISRKIYALSTIAACYDIVDEHENVNTLLDKLRVSIEQTNVYELSPIIGERSNGCEKLSDPEIIKAVQTAKSQRIDENLFGNADSNRDLTLINYGKANEMITLASTHAKRDEFEAVSNLLEQALSLSETIFATSNRTSILIRIAATCAEIKNPKVTDVILEKIEAIAEKSSEIHRIEVLLSIVESYYKLDDFKRALAILEDAQQEIEKSIDYPTPSYPTVVVVGSGISLHTRIEIANLYAKLNESKVANEILEEELLSVTSMKSVQNQLGHLTAISSSYGEFHDPVAASIGLEKVKAIAENIQYAPESDAASFSSKSDVFGAVAKSYIKLNKLHEAREALHQATDQSEEVQNASTRSEKLVEITQIWCLLARQYLQQENSKQTREILHDSLKMTVPIQVLSGEVGNHKATALSAISAVWVSLENWRKVNHVVEQCTSDDCRALVWADALTNAAESRHPELVDEKVGEGELI